MSTTSVDFKRGSDMDEKILSSGVSVTVAATTVAEDTVEAAHQCTPWFSFSLLPFKTAIDFS
jgi:hypothetical protein